MRNGLQKRGGKRGRQLNGKEFDTGGLSGSSAVEGVKTSRRTEGHGLMYTVPKDSTHLPVSENWPGDSAVLRDSGPLRPLFNSHVPWESGPVIWGEVAFFSQE